MEEALEATAPGLRERLGGDEAIVDSHATVGNVSAYLCRRYASGEALGAGTRGGHEEEAGQGAGGQKHAQKDRGRSEVVNHAAWQYAVGHPLRTNARSAQSRGLTACSIVGPARAPRALGLVVRLFTQAVLGCVRKRHVPRPARDARPPSP